MATGRKVIVGDKRLESARRAAEELNNVGFDVEPIETDLSERDSILAAIAEARKQGTIKYLVNSAGVSPSQASVETILKVDLYGTAVLLEEVGKVIAPGGAGGPFRASRDTVCPHSVPKPTNCWRPHRPKRCSPSIYCGRLIYAIRSMPIKWPNAAT